MSDEDLDAVLKFIDENYNLRQLAVESDEREIELGFAVYQDTEGMKVTEVFEGTGDTIEYETPDNTILIATYHTHPGDVEAGMSLPDHKYALDKIEASGERFYALIGTSSELSIDVFERNRLNTNKIKVIKEDEDELAAYALIGEALGARIRSEVRKYHGRFSAKTFSQTSKRNATGRGWWRDTTRHSEAAKKGWGK